MTSRWGVRLAVALVVSSGWTYAESPDEVKLVNENGAEESGVIAWGKQGLFHARGISPLAIGTLSPGEANQLVAFTINRPPALDADVAWTGTNDTISLEYPTPYKIPIRIWVLCVDYDCTSPMPPSKAADLDLFRLWANERFLSEHVGITLEDSAEWVSDKTGMTGLGSTFFWDFVASETNCANLESTARSLGMREDGAFNIYMVRTVDSLYHKGHFCETDDSTVVGSMALHGTILHELVHDLGLWHIDGQTWETKVGGQKNLMSGDSPTRMYLTEGQVFRMHFTSGSGLNSKLSSHLPATLPPNRTLRDCDYPTPPSLPCPPQEMMLWKDH